MNINDLTAIIKKRLQEDFVIESINIEDKSFLHENHKGNQEGKYHLKLNIKSNQLRKIDKIASNRKIYKSLEGELKNYIHSIQILIT
tara:strand:+ start:236 stop:496 length:261 start_codon:yes stop_codon:yes gene_type:complete